MKTSEYDNGFNAGFNAARKMIADIAGFAYVPVETTLLSVENEVRDDPACFVREGYKEGREDGYAAGYSDGREDGYSIGYASGREYQECSAPTNSKPDGYKGGHYSDDTSNALEGHIALSNPCKTSWIVSKTGSTKAILSPERSWTSTAQEN